MSSEKDEEASAGTEIVLPESTRAEMVLETVATVAGIIPVLGSPISNILTGIAGDRRFDRMRKVVLDLAEDLRDASDTQQAYVLAEDFEDLLFETLQRVAGERSEEKRRAYGHLLASAVRNAGEIGYDEQLRYVRVLEELQPDHLGMLAAITQEPDESQGGVTSSLLGTLRSRLPEMPEEHVRDLAEQLDRMTLTNMGGALSAMMTARGAADLRSRLTPFGQRFVAYITDDSPG